MQASEHIVKPGDEKAFNVSLGRMLRAQRLVLGLRLQDVAEAIGVSYQQMQKYEKGINRISVFRLQQFSALYQIELKEIVSQLGTADMKPICTERYMSFAQSWQALRTAEQQKAMIAIAREIARLG